MESPGRLRTSPACSRSAGEGELLTVNPGRCGSGEGPLSTLLHLLGLGLGLGPSQRAPALWLPWALAQGEIWQEMAGREGGQPGQGLPCWLAAPGLSLCQMVAAPKSPSSTFLSLHPLSLAPPPASECLLSHPLWGRGWGGSLLLSPTSDYLILVCHLFPFWSPTTSSGHSED